LSRFNSSRKPGLPRLPDQRHLSQPRNSESTSLANYCAGHAVACFDLNQPSPGTIDFSLLNERHTNELHSAPLQASITPVGRLLLALVLSPGFRLHKSDSRYRPLPRKRSICNLGLNLRLRPVCGLNLATFVRSLAHVPKRTRAHSFFRRNLFLIQLLKSSYSLT